MRFLYFRTVYGELSIFRCRCIMTPQTIFDVIRIIVLKKVHNAQKDGENVPVFGRAGLPRELEGRIQ